MNFPRSGQELRNAAAYPCTTYRSNLIEEAPMNTANDAAFAAGYALNRHVPDMARGFIISTNYGDLIITDDEARQHPELQQTVKSILQSRLYDAERAAGAGGGS